LNKFKLEIVNYTYILLGSIAMACGIVGFLSPNKIATGGTAGLSIIFHHLFDISIGILMVLINLPLLFLSLKYLGKQFAIKTIITIVLVAVLVDFFTLVIKLPVFSSNLLLATLYGGVAIGVGLGLIFKGESSAGGASIVAKIIALKTSFKAGFVILVLDALVVITAGIVFKNIELALWSLIGIYVSSTLIDLILTGKQYEKIVHITSENLDVLGPKISKELGLTGTLIKGSDIDLVHEKHILFLVIETNRISTLKRLIQETDSKAYMVIMEASELLGPSRRIL
jgi:uncharacterized membrane-anchored protein YitT (DUF2179 family)